MIFWAFSISLCTAGLVFSFMPLFILGAVLIGFLSTIIVLQDALTPDHETY